MLLAAPTVWSACLDFSTSPDELMYLTFDRLPFPSVVAGDTLRDSTGVAATLTARAFAASGDQIQGAPLRFYALGDTSDALDVDSTTGRVVSEVAPPQALRVIASLAGVQSPPLTLNITKRPDSLAVDVARDTINYSLLDSTLNFSDQLAVKVLHNDSLTFYSGVTGWVVRYTLERETDTVSASIVDDQNRRVSTSRHGLFHIDTTTSDGVAGRKLRIEPGPPLNPTLDSVAVRVDATYRGLPIAGSPARIVVLVRPRTGG